MPLSSLAVGLPAGAEWIIILVIALLIFGSKLPNIMRGLGGSIREFKQGMNSETPTTSSTSSPNSLSSNSTATNQPQTPIK